MNSRGGSQMKYVLFTVVFICLISFQNCAPPQMAFSDSASLGSSGEEVNNDGSVSETFKVSSGTALLDMIWVIDNSGSMVEESGHVQKNFNSFLTYLNKGTNFRMLLVSANSGVAGVVLPTSFSSSTHHQVSQFISSSTGPSRLIDVLKGNQVPANFLRTKSKKVIVFVTDDNSTMKASAFLQDLPYATSEVSVFGFIGLGAQSPCQDRIGTVYKDLAAATGGKSYNICNADWTASFADLQKSSVMAAERTFVLANDVKVVNEVRIDGVALSANKFSVKNRVVTIADAVVLNTNSTVMINYDR